MKHLTRESYNDAQLGKSYTVTIRVFFGAELRSLYVGNTFITHTHGNSKTHVIVADLLSTQGDNDMLTFRVKATSTGHIHLRLYTFSLYTYMCHISTSHTPTSFIIAVAISRRQEIIKYSQPQHASINKTR